MWPESLPSGTDGIDECNSKRILKPQDGLNRWSLIWTPSKFLASIYIFFQKSSRIRSKSRNIFIEIILNRRSKNNFKKVLHMKIYWIRVFLLFYSYWMIQSLILLLPDLIPFLNVLIVCLLSCGSWLDTWDCMEKECKEEVVLLPFASIRHKLGINQDFFIL